MQFDASVGRAEVEHEKHLKQSWYFSCNCFEAWTLEMWYLLFLKLSHEPGYLSWKDIKLAAQHCWYKPEAIFSATYL